MSAAANASTAAWAAQREEWIAAGKFPNPFRPGQRAAVRKGAIILSTQPGRKLKCAAKRLAVTIVEASPLYVYWAGGGGYWRWASYFDCEVLDEAFGEKRE